MVLESEPVGTVTITPTADAPRPSYTFTHASLRDVLLRDLSPDTPTYSQVLLTRETAEEIRRQAERDARA